MSVCPSQNVRCVGHVTCVAFPLVGKGSGCASSPFTLFPDAPAAFSAVGLRRRSPAAMATSKLRDLPVDRVFVQLCVSSEMEECVCASTPEHTWLHLSASVSAFRRVPPLALGTAGGVYVSQTVRESEFRKGAALLGLVSGAATLMLALALAQLEQGKPASLVRRPWR